MVVQDHQLHGDAFLACMTKELIKQAPISKARLVPVKDLALLINRGRKPSMILIYS
jgi:hypothetical protein